MDLSLLEAPRGVGDARDALGVHRTGHTQEQFAETASTPSASHRDHGGHLRRLGDSGTNGRFDVCHQIRANVVSVVDVGRFLLAADHDSVVATVFICTPTTEAAATVDRISGSAGSGPCAVRGPVPTGLGVSRRNSFDDGVRYLYHLFPDDGFLFVSRRADTLQARAVVRQRSVVQFRHLYRRCRSVATVVRRPGVHRKQVAGFVLATGGLCSQRGGALFLRVDLTAVSIESDVGPCRNTSTDDVLPLQLTTSGFCELTLLPPAWSPASDHVGPHVTYVLLRQRTTSFFCELILLPPVARRIFFMRLRSTMKICT